MTDTSDQRTEPTAALEQYKLGLMCYTGKGMPQDYKEAVKWFRLAAEQGHAKAQFSLGLMYDEGTGVPSDYKEAAKWHRLAAEQGEILAQFHLGYMYEEGEGVPQDDREAVKWFLLAAEQGEALAQSDLELLYRSGMGVPQDYSKGGRDWRPSVIYDTNIKTSYAAGRYAQMQDIKALRPYWRYRHSHATVEPRERHLAWDGLILAADDPWWSTHYPPNGWGCKCYVESLSQREFDATGKSKPDTAPPLDSRLVEVKGRSRSESVPAGIDPGFAYAPGKAAYESSKAR